MCGRSRRARASTVLVKGLPDTTTNRRRCATGLKGHAIGPTTRSTSPPAAPRTRRRTNPVIARTRERVAINADGTGTAGVRDSDSSAREGLSISADGTPWTAVNDATKSLYLPSCLRRIRDAYARQVDHAVRQR